MSNATATAPLTRFSRWWLEYRSTNGPMTLNLVREDVVLEVARDAYEAGRADVLAGLGGGNLTPTQLRVLRLIVNYRGTEGCSPTLQEIADELGVSKVTVFGHVKELCEKGKLRRVGKHLTRNIEVVQSDGDAGEEAEVTAMPPAAR